jgi:hypothetical protein
MCQVAAGITGGFVKSVMDALAFNEDVFWDGCDWRWSQAFVSPERGFLGHLLQAGELLGDELIELVLPVELDSDRALPGQAGLGRPVLARGQRLPGALFLTEDKLLVAWAAGRTPGDGFCADAIGLREATADRLDYLAPLRPDLGFEIVAGGRRTAFRLGAAPRAGDQLAAVLLKRLRGEMGFPTWRALAAGGLAGAALW